MIFIIGAFFCYGMYTIQRNGFLLDGLPTIWKKIPKSLHEPLFSCGVCVSSIWGILFLVSSWLISTYVQTEYRLLANIPLYIIAFGGMCAVIDRAVKFFEYGYKYTQIKSLSNYSYLENYEFRNSMIDCFLKEVTAKAWKIIEIGGVTTTLESYAKYQSFQKCSGNDITDSYVAGDYFILIKGLAFEGDFRELLHLLANSKGFIIEGSLAGDSGKQLNWIMDEYKSLIRLPYMTNTKCEAPTHCAGDINNRIILIKE